jgi:hypothetical protein
MKLFRTIDVNRAWLLAVCLAFCAALNSEHAASAIANTKHNLSTLAPAGQNRVTVGTDEICVFCHTPHGGDTTAPAPLWNKNLSGVGSGGYTTYATLGSSTIDGLFASDGVGGGSVGSVSMACLSCHDGTQAMDNIINAPGSGGYNVTGGGPTGLNYTWDTVTGRVNATGNLINANGFIANLGTDLSNDHPIGIQYCGGGPNTGAPAGACVDKDFNAPQSRQIGATRVWWVDTTGGTAAVREKSDMILYTRNFSGTVGPSVECGSCHDPHAETGSGTPAAGQTFLRISNAGSAVCLSCHVK